MVAVGIRVMGKVVICDGGEVMAAASKTFAATQYQLKTRTVSSRTHSRPWGGWVL